MSSTALCRTQTSAARPRTARSLNSTLPSDIPLSLSPSLSSILCLSLLFPTACHISGSASALPLPATALSLSPALPLPLSLLASSLAGLLPLLTSPLLLTRAHRFFSECCSLHSPLLREREQQRALSTCFACLCECNEITVLPLPQRLRRVSFLAEFTHSVCTRPKQFLTFPRDTPRGF